VQPTGGISGWEAEEVTDYWFDEPLPDDRRSWAVPAGHGTYQGLDLELLDPDDEGELTFLLEAQHLELEEALERGEEITTADGEPMNPRLPISDACGRQVSAGDTSRRRPTNGQTSKPVVAVRTAGSAARIPMWTAVRPSSSHVSRMVVARGLASLGSQLPPGSAICPAWRPREARLTSTTRSSPWPSR
jgi:hypothetical protein